MALAPTGIKVAGHWKSVDQASIKIGGHWKGVDQIMEKVAGHWKHIGTTRHPPLFTGAIGDLQAIVGEPFTLDISHLFSTGPAVASYNLNHAPAGMVISAAGVISWPTPVKGDTSGVSVTATNAGGFAVSDAFGVSAIALGPELAGNTFDTDVGGFVNFPASASLISWDSATQRLKIVYDAVPSHYANNITYPLKDNTAYVFSIDVDVRQATDPLITLNMLLGNANTVWDGKTTNRIPAGFNGRLTAHVTTHARAAAFGLSISNSRKADCIGFVDNISIREVLP